MITSHDYTQIASTVNDRKGKMDFLDFDEANYNDNSPKLFEKEQFEAHEDVAQDRRLLIPFTVIDAVTRSWILPPSLALCRYLSL